MLINTKLQQPRLQTDSVLRPHLIDRLTQGLDRKLTLISAQAGAGKSTLLAQWLQGCGQPSAWLTLDENDNDLLLFVSYLCGAVRTVFPDSCGQVFDLLNASQTPPARVVMAVFVNELDDYFARRQPPEAESKSYPRLILALDDFHTITEPAIHQFVADLITYLPRYLHLAVTSRTDPLFRWQQCGLARR